MEQTQSIKDAVREREKQIKFFAKQKAELRQTVTQEYVNGLKTGMGEIPLRESLKERFDLTDRKLGNILDNRHQYLNAKEQAFTSGLVMNHYVTLIRAANEAIQGFDEYLEFIEQEKDSDFINVEQYAGAKGTGVKAVTPRELRGRVLRDKFDVVKDSFEPLKALAPKIVQFQDSTPQYDSLEDIQKQKAILKKQLKIEESTDEED